MAIISFEQPAKNPRADLGAQSGSKEQDHLNENEGM
jgi:hypothetical protein